MKRTLLLGVLAAGLAASAQAEPAAGDPGAPTLQLLQDQKTPPADKKGETQKGDAKKGQDKKKDGESKKKDKKDEITVWILDASGKG